MLQWQTRPRLTAASALLVAAAALAGCQGGTTYGTGVTQEQQTIEDLANLLTFRKKRSRIDYSARPDLVVPEDKALTQPVEETPDTAAVDWPETPEDRIAKVRAEAEEAEKTPGGKIRYALKEKRFRSQKKGIEGIEAPVGEGVPNVSCDPDGKLMRQCTDEEISRAVKAQRARLKGATGGQRKYLTEPPNEYTTPAGTAPVGDEGYTKAELKEIERLRKERERELSRQR